MEEKLNELKKAREKEIKEVGKMTINLACTYLTGLMEIAKEIECEISHKITGQKYRCKFSCEEIESEGEKDGK